jgi:hypothetical protein
LIATAPLSVVKCTYLRGFETDFLGFAGMFSTLGLLTEASGEIGLTALGFKTPCLGPSLYAHVLNSSLTKTEIAQVRKDITSGLTKLLYVAPESLTKEED